MYECTLLLFIFDKGIFWKKEYKKRRYYIYLPHHLSPPSFFLIFTLCTTVPKLVFFKWEERREKGNPLTNHKRVKS